MILVDTSVWVDHLRTNEPLLVEYLSSKQVLMHSAIIGELACGSFNNRVARFLDWHSLPPINELHNGDVITLIESRKLMCRGIGLVDAHILGAVLNHNGSLLWTRDKRLHGIAVENNVAFIE